MALISHVCPFEKCTKAFASVAALGSHSRIHSFGRRTKESIAIEAPVPTIATVAATATVASSPAMLLDALPAMPAAQGTGSSSKGGARRPQRWFQ
jgi:hypothetical protein